MCSLHLLRTTALLLNAPTGQLSAAYSSKTTAIGSKVYPRISGYKKYTEIS